MMPPLNLRHIPGIAFDGKTDDGAAIAMALAIAKAHQQPLLIPAGVCAYGRTLVAEGVQIIGEEGATLHSLNPLQAAIILRGVGPELRGVRLTGVAPTVRTSAAETARVLAQGASRFAITRVTIESGSGTGIHLRGLKDGQASSDGRITKCAISGTLADSIHVTDRSIGILIEDNEIANSGDDGIAVVSYRAQGAMVTGVTARRNRIRDNRGGRCMSVIGGSDVLYDDNDLSGNPHAAGILFAQEEGTYKTFGTRNVTARRNTVRNCGHQVRGHAGIFVTSAGADTNEGVLLERNLVVQDDATLDEARLCLRVLTPYNKGVKLDSNLPVGLKPEQIASPDVTVKAYAGGPVGITWER